MITSSEYAFGPRLDWKDSDGAWISYVCVGVYYLRVRRLESGPFVGWMDLSSGQPTTEPCDSLVAAQIAAEKLLRRHLVGIKQAADKMIELLNGGKRFQLGQQVSVYEDEARTKLRAVATVEKIGRKTIQLSNGEWFRQATMRNVARAGWLAPTVPEDIERLKAARDEEARQQAIQKRREVLNSACRAVQGNLISVRSQISRAQQDNGRYQKEQDGAIRAEEQARVAARGHVEREQSYVQSLAKAEADLAAFEASLK